MEIIKLDSGSVPEIWRRAGLPLNDLQDMLKENTTYEFRFPNTATYEIVRID